jgi:FKBP-type peptidyl-prolyl cis-trans isomerase FkpA/FKBP-type peptidyl-prolyl cis-trans isomerase FklB
MRTAIAWSLVALLAGVLPATAAEPEPQTDDEKTLYALGVVISQNLAAFTLSERELELIKGGLTDGALGRPQKVDLQAYGRKIQELRTARVAGLVAAEKKASLAFVDRAAAEEGAVRTPSGLIITTIRPGTGASPGPNSQVTVHYHGTLIDGTVFDSSVQRGEPAALTLGSTIRCWVEGVPMMKVGGKSRLVCPPELAYGDRGAPPRIKPGATLVFEVELLDIAK